MGLVGWQWLFIIESATGAFCAIFICPFIIPDFPSSNSGPGKWLLTDDMRRLAAARIEADRVSEPKASNSVWYGLKLALLDVKTWAFVCFDHSLARDPD